MFLNLTSHVIIAVPHGVNVISHMAADDIWLAWMPSFGARTSGLYRQGATNVLVPGSYIGLTIKKHRHTIDWNIQYLLGEDPWDLSLIDTRQDCIDPFLFTVQSPSLYIQIYMWQRILCVGFLASRCSVKGEAITTPVTTGIAYT